MWYRPIVIVLALTQLAAPRVGNGEVAFRFEQTGLALEGVTYDPQSRAFFFSSRRQRKVLRRGADGAVADFSRPSDELLSVVGLGVDVTRRRLWITTSGSPDMIGFRKEDEKISFLIEYDIETRALRRRIPPPPGLERALLSDLAVGPNGDVFVADPIVGRIYVLRQGASALLTLTDAGPIRSAQGIAPSADGRFLFVADYARGIVRVDTASGAVLPLPAPPDVAVRGIDGLVLHGSDLIGVQNGIRPHRVVRLRLDDARELITAVETLEQNHPEHDEPTLGVIVGDAFYYVANSLAGGANDQRDPPRPSVILRLSLR